METVAAALTDIVDRFHPVLSGIPGQEAALQPAPGKWSKKQILGHLIDSACNNHQKFVRTMLAETPVDFVGYEQDAWVAIQHYEQHNWPEIIALWAAYNRHLASLIRSASPAQLDHTIRVSGNGPYNLRFIMADYVEHLKHHLIQIIPDSGLGSSFSMEPYV